MPRRQSKFIDIVFGERRLWFPAVDWRTLNGGCNDAVRVGCLGDLIDPLAKFRFDFGRFAEHQGEYLMAGGDFGEVQIRIKADSFEACYFFFAQGAIKVVGHEIRVIHAFGIHFGRAQTQLFRHTANTIHQFRGKLTLFNLSGKRLRILSFQHPIHIGKQRSQGQSHRTNPRSFVYRG